MEEPAISISIEDASNSVLFHYSDNGRGIDINLSDRIFDPFFTTGKTSDHNGLGLFLARKLAVDHIGGNLEHIDNGEQGTRFLLTLPGFDGGSSRG